MAEKEEPRRPRGEQFSEPPEYGEAIRHPADQSWVLQLLIDLKSSVSELKEAVRTLQKDSEKQSDKLSTISHQIYGAALVLVVILGLGTFLLDKFWDVIVKIVEKGVS